MVWLRQWQEKVGKSISQMPIPLLRIKHNLNHCNWTHDTGNQIVEKER